MIKIINDYGYEPNVLHFHGENINQLPMTFNRVKDDAELNKLDNKIAVVSTWTDENTCCLLQQCKKFGINLINCVPEDYDKSQEWYMPNKIKFFIKALENIDNEIVMFLDGYDVLFATTDNLLDKFLSCGYRILFGPSCNNYPDVMVDRIYARYKMGVYRYFNAGCCIGYREDLLKFYKEALNYINVYNPKNSEQLVIRHAFAKYSLDPNQKFIWIDYQGKIFQSMGCLNSTAPENDSIIRIWPNKILTTNYVVTGSNGFIGKHLVSELEKQENTNVFKIDRKSGSEIDSLNWIIANYNIDCVFHLAAQTSVFNDNREQIVKDNIISFMTVCDLCNKYGIKLVYASSSTANNANTTSLYGISKNFDEQYAKIYCPNAVGVRLHNVYSETDPREGTLMWHLLNDDETILYNNGKNVRCFTHIDDAVAGLITCEYIEGINLINCVNYEPITTEEFAKLASNFNSKIKYKLTDEIRDKDNNEQAVDMSIPLLNVNYKSVKDIFK